MRTMQVYPSIVWSTDPRSMALLETLGQRLGRPWGLFIRHAGNARDAITIAREYNTLDFEESLRAQGVNLAGTRAGTCVLRIAVVATVGEEGENLQERVREVEEARRRMEEVVGIDAFHWVVVAETLGGIEQRGLEEIRPLPWLLSRFTSSSRELGDESFTRWVMDLLQMIVGIDASSEVAEDQNIRRFHHPLPPGRGYVRLVGFPRRSPDPVMEDLVSRSLTLLRRQLDSVTNTTRKVGRVRQELERQAKMLRGEAVELRDFLDAVFGHLGLGGLDLGELARDGNRLLRRCGTILKEHRSGGEMMPVDPGDAGGVTGLPVGLLQRFVIWLGHLVHLDLCTRPPQPPPRRATVEVVEEALRRIGEGRRFLEEWAGKTGEEGRRAAVLPPTMVDEWNSRHLERVRRSLRGLARGEDGGKEAENVWDFLGEMARSDLVLHLPEVLGTDEGTKAAIEDIVQDVRRGGMHYSAPLKGGAIPSRAGLLTTIPGNPFRADHENASSVMFGTQPRLVVMGYSDPVPVEQIHQVSWGPGAAGSEADEGEE